ncbi:MAG: class I SAM-dependent methyltransferase [Saprospiraceae bacterium]|nr:class I SAM-dependent methyltransferase [Pyrinomonadaceae bacterium]
MTTTVERFSDRVENYVKYRPGYPADILQFFRDEMNLTKSSVIADIGSGTGISSEVFLENGNKVFGVEPNNAMRNAAEEFLRDFPNFTSLEGTAENTNLPDNSVDYVVAAQAFHWFDQQKTLGEFRRILQSKGYVALIWNERQLDSTRFLIEYEKFLIKFANDYTKVRHDNIDEKSLADFFEADFRRKTFQNEQVFDFEGLKGRVLSSSYMPSESSENYEPMVAELRALFAKHAESGKIKVFYDTNIFYSEV